jgi:von Willebrand factor type A domain
MRTESRIPPLGPIKKSTSPVVVLIAAVVLSICSQSVIRSQDPVETIRIESDLVDLKVSVLGVNPTTTAPLLGQKDFQVLEDGSPQEISFFAAADAPFDLVLLLDVSGSTAKKLKMIRRSAKRFVDAARPVDRIAVVTFTDQSWVYSGFSLDRKQLKKDIDDIDDAYGGTNFWDSLNFVLRHMLAKNNGLRRGAVVVMTDGVDNALPDVRGPGSQKRLSFLSISTSKQKPSKSTRFHLLHVPRPASNLRRSLPRAAQPCIARRSSRISISYTRKLSGI